MAWVDYDQHARTLRRDDFWGQVRRTVRGRPVGPEQIEMIVSAIVDQLRLGPDDILLDLACGNGALSALLQPHCQGSLGVDISPYLIEVARERFETGTHRFAVQEAAAFTEDEPDPARFTKALCYRQPVLPG
jgi:tRNA/tmRNA/rRNA uracil-C5-methylase (TrmA/RlmC/RlmD family)